MNAKPQQNTTKRVHNALNIIVYYKHTYCGSGTPIVNGTTNADNNSLYSN